MACSVKAVQGEPAVGSARCCSKAPGGEPEATRQLSQCVPEFNRACGWGSAGLVFLGSHSGNSVVVEVPEVVVAACPVSDAALQWRTLHPGAIENLAPGCNPVLFEDPPGGCDLPAACFILAGCNGTCTRPHSFEAWWAGGGSGCGVGRRLGAEQAAAVLRESAHRQPAGGHVRRSADSLLGG